MGLFSSIKKLAGPVLSVAGAATGQPWLAAAGTALGGMADNSAKAALAGKANDLSLYMSSTAHQREVADLKAAGLNPILSAGGSGASTPGVAVPQYTDQADKAMSTSLQVQQAKAAIDNLKMDTQKKQAEMFLTDNIGAKTIIDRQNALKQGLLLDAGLPEAAANAELYSGDAGVILKAIERVSPTLGGLVSSAKGAKTILSKANPGMKLPLKGK